ncbi:hypothetical protein [Photorhabdus asymbiotica]|uniref:hypothetical protein n=1 Tax=Photorhabdus asymbiotica TaxID=291112 RepID=UPI003DA71B0B
MPIVFKSISSTLSTSSSSWVNISGLSISVNEQALQGSSKALVILNIPTPYATGSDYPGIEFAITMNSTVLASGAMTYSDKSPSNPGRTPFTLQTCIDLTNIENLGAIQAQWKSIRGSTAHIDSYCSISAIINEVQPGH